jgi:hypothetical protein
MQIRHFGGFGSPGINDDQLACGILADLIEMVARIGEAVRDPGICTDDKQEIAMMHVLGGVAGLAAEHVAIFSCERALKTLREPSARNNPLA